MAGLLLCAGVLLFPHGAQAQARVEFIPSMSLFLSSLNTLDARGHALGETRLRVTPFTTLGLAVRYDRSETPGEIDIDSGVLDVLLYRAEQELPLRDLVDSTRCASANWVGGSRIHHT